MEDIGTAKTGTASASAIGEYMNVAIIGVGKVGATIAYSMIFSRKVHWVKLIDIDNKRLEGEYIDLCQASFVLRHTNIFVRSSLADIEGSDRIFITAGIKKDFVVNTSIIKTILRKLRNVPRKNIFIVTNPSNELAAAFGTIPIGDYHRKFGNCQAIVELKGYTNWGIAAECLRASRRE